MIEESKKVSKIFIIPILLILAVGGIYLHYNSSISQPLGESEEKVTFNIEDGATVNEILNSLAEEELLENIQKYYTRFYLKINNLEGSLQAGTYQIPRQLTIIELIEVLQTGRAQDIWVLIPEGLRKDEIAEIIHREFRDNGVETFFKDDFLLLTEDANFITSLDLGVEIPNLEGFLFPDRYAFPRDASATTVIEKMITNFKTKVGENFTYEEIILASIVEREGYNSNDRPIIAGILLKRYREGWLLQTDATLLYPGKDWKHVITIQDKEDDNPYNTYKKLGLPPTPICNPGLQSVEAVWNPQETPYYFYIHDKDGNAHYATTLEEHNRNVNKYLR
jgi:UPF0755 protein